MSLSFYERRRILKKVNYMEITPFKIYDEEVDSNGRVTIIVPKFKKEFAINIIKQLGKPMNIRIKLDEFGSEVWQLLNGNRNVTAICKKLVEKFGDKIQPVEERLTKFLTNLYLQGYISFNEIKSEGD